ncbi:hypothetical protein DAI22_06g166300 [Oryza sativa Japonica Group]|jgi:hypothetical protein|nr:hypothetical protein DAI22_06g166300 [Oryza sativa Japonica Group]
MINAVNGGSLRTSGVGRHTKATHFPNSPSPPTGMLDQRISEQQHITIRHGTGLLLFSWS